MLIHNAHIGIAVGFAILAVGIWPAHTSETAMSILETATFFITLGVFLGLSMRDKRAYERRSEGSEPH